MHTKIKAVAQVIPKVNMFTCTPLVNVVKTGIKFGITYVWHVKFSKKIKQAM